MKRAAGIEKRVAKRVRKQNIKLAILTALKVGGIISLMALAPNTLKLLRYVQKPRTFKYRLSRSLNSLIGRGLVSVDADGRVHLTQKGLRYLNALSQYEFRIERPRKWDGQWRIIIFDIPEHRRKARDHLRMTLEQIGFIKLQESVWVYPFPCEDLISLIKTDFLLGREVLYIVANEIERDSALRKHFELPSE